MKRSPFLNEFEREQRWCEAWFQADLTEEDRDWLRKHIELAGARVPEVDISWISFEKAPL